MKLTDQFIRRPVLAIVVNLVILIAGAIIGDLLHLKHDRGRTVGPVKTQSITMGGPNGIRIGSGPAGPGLPGATGRGATADVPRTADKEDAAVDAKLEKAMTRAFREVSDFSRTKKVDMRIAAYALALQRIEAVYKEREIFP